MKIRLFLVMMAPVVASAQTVSCPPRLVEDSVTVTKVPQGWVAASSGAARLDGGGMLSGNPKQMQYLVPASSKKVRGGGSSTWNFDVGDEKWFFCTYGRATVELSKRMDDRTTSCVVESKNDRVGALAELTATCR